MSDAHYVHEERALWAGGKQGLDIYGPNEPEGRRLARLMAQ